MSRTREFIRKEFPEIEKIEEKIANYREDENDSRLLIVIGRMLGRFGKMLRSLFGEFCDLF